jgi:uncharacterized protein
MSTRHKITEALLSNNINQAREYLKAGESIPKDIDDGSNFRQIISNILKSKAFDLIDLMVADKLIETDVYEFDEFRRSIIQNLATALPDDEESLQFLSGFMAKVKNKNDEVKDQTLLGYCMEAGASPAIIKGLIDAGCATDFKTNGEKNFIHQVVNNNMLKPEKGLAYLDLLLKQGVDLNAKDKEGTTPVLLAIERHKEEYLKFLLENGADANETDGGGNSAFYHAVVNLQEPKLYDLLAQYASPSFEQVNKEGESLLAGFLRMLEGSSERQLQLLEKMIQAGADFNQTALYYGQPKSGLAWVAEKSVDVLKVVLAGGKVDINGQDSAGNTLLHLVCAYNINFEQEQAKNTYRKVKLLIENGADVNKTNDRDETPLMLASKDNLKVKTVELLLENKATAK